jgi:hypothetical protein
MKILFVGPTLYGEVRGGRLDHAPEIICQGPARHGDIAKSVLEGASVIGLIDGRYEDVPSPWHKEILFALSEGIHVLGGGSLGALRAAECAAFGMTGVGVIFERIVKGEIIDDSDVAQLHAPEEMHFLPLTEALVNVDETFRRVMALGLIDAKQYARLISAARSLFFKHLTFESVIDRCSLPLAEAERLRELVGLHRADLKREDAHALVKIMVALPTERRKAPPPWTLAKPAVWERYIAGLRHPS